MIINKEGIRAQTKCGNNKDAKTKSPSTPSGIDKVHRVANRSSGEALNQRKLSTPESLGKTEPLIHSRPRHSTDPSSRRMMLLLADQLNAKISGLDRRQLLYPRGINEPPPNVHWSERDLVAPGHGIRVGLGRDQLLYPRGISEPSQIARRSKLYAQHVMASPPKAFRLNSHQIPTRTWHVVIPHSSAERKDLLIGRNTPRANRSTTST